MSYQEEIFEFDNEQQDCIKELLLHDISGDPDLDLTPINVASSSCVSVTQTSHVAAHTFVSSRDVLNRYQGIRSEVDSLKCDLEQLLLIQNCSENTMWSFLHQSIMEVKKELSSLEGIGCATSNEFNYKFDQLLDNSVMQQIVRKNGALSNFVAEQRLDKLEKYLGAKDFPITYRGISSTLADLENKLETLKHSGDRQRIVSRLSSLRGEFDSLISKLSVETLKSVVEFNNSVQKFESVIDYLPNVSSRLRTLDTIHWKANNCVKLVENLESGLTRLETISSSNKELYEALNSQLAMNLEVMHQNVEKIESRFRKIE